MSNGSAQNLICLVNYGDTANFSTYYFKLSLFRKKKTSSLLMCNCIMTKQGTYCRVVNTDTFYNFTLDVEEVGGILESNI